MIVVAAGGIELGRASESDDPDCRGGASKPSSLGMDGFSAAATGGAMACPDAAFALGRAVGSGTDLLPAAAVLDAGLAAGVAVGLAAAFASGYGLASALDFDFASGLLASGLACPVVCALGFSTVFVFWAIAGCASANTPATASGQIVPGRILETNGGFPWEMRIVDFRIDSYCIDWIDESENSVERRLQLGAPIYLSPR
jgi:hypothetical protein